MEIKSIAVLGAGCPGCKTLYETVKKIAAELKIAAPVEYVDDINKMIELGLMTSPALTVNGRPVLTGGGHSEDDIKKALREVSEKAAPSGCCNCNCVDC